MEWDIEFEDADQLKFDGDATVWSDYEVPTSSNLHDCINKARNPIQSTHSF
jgi:hypothetical protein